MSFPTKVAENLLVACNRCCCICHKFKGPDLELHHIVPVAEGGSDDEENGIPLCYECHSAVHAYKKNPIGKSYSASELKRHKEKWFRGCNTFTFEELEALKNEILGYIESLNIPLLHNTLYGLSNTIETLIKSKKNEQRREAFTKKYGVKVIDNARYFAKLGELEMEFRNYDDARRNLEAAIEIEPDLAEAYLNLFKVELTSGNYEVALKRYKKAISLSPELAILPDRYEIHVIMGVGGSAIVYKAFDKVSNHLVAVKVLRGEIMQNFNLAIRFRDEAKILSSLTHPGILDIFDYGSFQGRYYIVLEYVEGILLKYLLDSRKLDRKSIIQVFISIAEAISYLHKQKIIHCDLKPSNIYVRSNMSAMLFDFGIAFTGYPLSTLTSSTIGPIGTLSFMAPESLFQAHTITTAVDVYSLGVMLFEALTGVVPRILVNPWHYLRGESKRFQNLVRNMISVDFRQRPLMDEVVKILKVEYKKIS